MLHRFWNVLRGLWRRGGGSLESPAGNAEAPVAAGAAKPPPARRGGYVEPDAFTAMLVGMARDDGLRKHRLHVFSLSEFRRASGEKWGRITALLGMVVDRIIDSHIDPDKDLFTRLDAETACLMMRGTSRQEAGVRVAAIARDLTAQLIGAQSDPSRPARVIAADLAVGALIDPAGALRRQAIAEAVDQARRPAPSPPPPLATAHRETLAALLAPEDAGLLAPRLVPLDRPAGPPSTPAEAGPAMVWRRQDGLGPPRPAQVWTLHGLDGASRLLPVLKIERKRRGEAEDVPEWLAERAGLAAAAEPAEAGDEAMAAAAPEWFEEQMAAQARQAGAGGLRLKPETSLSLLWSPVWVTNRRAIGAFHARVVRSDGGASPPLVGGEAYRDVSPVEALALDRFTAAQVARELTDLYLGGRRIGLTLPLHWTSLAPRWRDCIRLPLEQCPAAARRKLLKIEVFGLSAAIPPRILRDLLGPLGRLGCDAMARLPLAATDLVPFIRHVKAVGTDLGECEADKLGEDQLFDRLHRFRQATRDANLACYAWGVSHRGLIARLVADGFSLVNGPAVMADISRPRAA